MALCVLIALPPLLGAGWKTIYLVGGQWLPDLGVSLRSGGDADGASEGMARRQETAVGAALDSELTRWLAALELEDYKPRTRAEYRATVARVWKACGWGCAADATAAGLKEHLTQLVQRGRSAKWVVNTHSAAKVFLAWAQAEGLVHANAAAGIKLPDPKRQPKRRAMRPFSPDESEAIIAAAIADEASATPRHRLGRSVYYRVLQATGGRRSEVGGESAIRWRDVDLDSDRPGITFDESVAKGEAGRVPLVGPVVEALRSWRDAALGAGPDSLVFPDRPHHRVLWSDMAAAGVPRKDPKTGKGAGFHSFRHGLATALIRAGVDPAHAQKILRHKDIRQTTDIYTHLTQDDLREALERPPKKVQARNAREHEELRADPGDSTQQNHEKGLDDRNRSGTLYSGTTTCSPPTPSRSQSTGQPRPVVVPTSSRPGGPVLSDRVGSPGSASADPADPGAGNRFKSCCDHSGNRFAVELIATAARLLATALSLLSGDPERVSDGDRERHPDNRP